MSIITNILRFEFLYSLQMYYFAMDQRSWTLNRIDGDWLEVSLQGSFDSRRNVSNRLEYFTKILESDRNGKNICAKMRTKQK